MAFVRQEREQADKKERATMLSEATAAMIERISAIAASSARKVARQEMNKEVKRRLAQMMDIEELKGKANRVAR
jgi:hypothetical protein